MITIEIDDLLKEITEVETPPPALCTPCTPGGLPLLPTLETSFSGRLEWHWESGFEADVWGCQIDIGTWTRRCAFRSGPAALHLLDQLSVYATLVSIGYNT